MNAHCKDVRVGRRRFLECFAAQDETQSTSQQHQAGHEKAMLNMSHTKVENRVSQRPLEGGWIAKQLHRLSAVIAAIVVSAGYCCASATAAEVVVTCTAPTQYTDNSPLTDLASYRVYYGTSQSSLIQTKDFPGTDGCNRMLIDGLTAGTYYFAVTARNAAGTESDFSNVASKTTAASSGNELCLVDGIAVGTRPVYSVSATGTRGKKITDLIVGPTSQPAGTTNPIRVPECSCTDLKNWSGAIYSKVKDGYVAGCKTYGQR